MGANTPIARSAAETRNEASSESPWNDIHTVTSRDGTHIGYRQVGEGPGLILVQGAMGTASNYHQLALALANDFTVYVPDRRGRGMSPREYSPEHSIQGDVEDLDSILTHSGAHFVFGLSSGAVIALEASRTLRSISKVALYEPPLVLEGISQESVARFNSEIHEGRLPAALVTAMSIVKLGPPLLRLIPRSLLELPIRRALRSERKKASGEYATISDLLPAMRYDFNVVAGKSGPIDSFREVGAETLLLGGGKSPKYLKDALDALQRILPHVQRTEFKGLDHSAAWNTDRGGDPQPVAKSLRAFFTGPSSTSH
jgi:pimeloyl-ACP methyl ester carboxylesterase